MVYPASLSTPAIYTFWVRETVAGQYMIKHGPYVLHVGCTPSSITVSENTLFVNSALLDV